MKARTTFYYPKKKVSVETSTTPIQTERKESNVVDDIETSVKQSLFEQNYDPKTKYERMLMDQMKSQVIFFNYTLGEEGNSEFDTLTVQKDIYSKIQPSFRFELNSIGITIGNPKNNEVISFPYHENLKPVLECLETKRVSPELHELLKIVRCDTIEDGSYLCECVDFRCTPPIAQHLIMTLDENIIKDNEVAFANPLQYEQEMLLASYPDICVDPSMDVARAMSVIDWREKMWTKQHPEDGKADFLPIQKPNLRQPVKHIAPTTSNGRINISQSLNSVFTALNQAHM